MKKKMRQWIRVLWFVVPVVLCIVLGQGVFSPEGMRICLAEPVLEFDFKEDKESVSTPVLPKKLFPSSVLPSSPRAGDVWKEPVTGMEFVWVPGGCYMMGSPLTGKTAKREPEEYPLWYKTLAAVSSLLPYGCVSSSSSVKSYYDTHGYHEEETPVHEVCLDGFWIGRYEVSQGQWRKIMGSNPSRSKSGDDFPVENVSWNDAKQFISRLNEQTGHPFALPTEAQWEYAARSGGREETYAGGNDVDRVAWYKSNSGGKTHRVGTKDPNGLGIYDMSGNVWEWCEDVHVKNAYSRHARNNPVVTSGDSARVVRGGSWISSNVDVRTSYRIRDSAVHRSIYRGVRLSLTPESDALISSDPKAGSKAASAEVTELPAAAKSSSKNCGAYTAPGVWKEFDCYNLAAIGKTTNDDPFTPSWRLIGGYWQWGRKGPDPSQWYDTNTRHFAHGPTGPGSEDDNSSVISKWDRSHARNGSWSDSRKTANDNCPEGFRIPTRSQWDGVINNNSQRIVGSWSKSYDDQTNYSSGRFFGNKLMLPANGFRRNGSGSLSLRGYSGNYWSSSGPGPSGYHKDAGYLTFGSNSASTGSSSGRDSGFSVRCIAE